MGGRGERTLTTPTHFAHIFYIGLCRYDVCYILRSRKKLVLWEILG